MAANSRPEFCGIGFLIYQRMNTLSVPRLADEASRMRLFLRSRHKDIRSNTNLFKDIYEYMGTVPAGKRPGEIAAREEFNGTNDDDEIQQARARKRQREESADGTYLDNAPLRGEESAVIDSLRSKKKKSKTPKADKADKADKVKKDKRSKTKIPENVVVDTAIPSPSVPAPTQYPTQPPPAYDPHYTPL